jgi:hypothetical protein
MRLPTDQDRVMVIGATGEGKTVGALWLLSYAPFHDIPYIIIDYKRDPLIRRLQEEVAVPVIYDNRVDTGAWPTVPVDPGLYIMRPDPEQKEEMNNFLLQIWRQENTGLFCDEAFMIPQKRPYKAFDNLLTSGRSLHIPMIMLYQRPVDMSQYATSQAEYWAVFNLRKPKDIETANEYIGVCRLSDGTRVDASYHLPRYHWLWYDVVHDICTVMRPVPPPDAILEKFRGRLGPQQSALEQVLSEEKPRPMLRIY